MVCGCTGSSSASLRPREAGAIATFRPSAVAVFRDPVEGSPRNSFLVTITEIEPLADLIRVHAGSLHADVTVQAAADLSLDAGLQVTFLVKATEVRSTRADSVQCQHDVGHATAIATAPSSSRSARSGARCDQRAPR